MIQELFGGNISNQTAGGGLIVAEKEPSSHHTGVLQPSHASSPLPSSSSSTTTTTVNPKPSSEILNPLRCPRCDSPNTKFCYYNNYNLTQPRHFCKTCRRYWTKGGALRNVPIGGGCRKNNKTNISHAISSSLEKPCTAKLIRSHLLSADNIGKASSGYLGGFDHGGLSPNTLLWTSPQTSHLLALLRSNQTQNPNPNFNYSIINPVKEEGFLNGSGGLRLDPYDNNQLSSFWRNDERSRAELQQQSGGLVMQNLSNQVEVCNQRVSFKSADNYYSDNYVPALLMGNGHAPSPNHCSDILDSTPVVGGGQLVNCWNNNTSLSRPDLPTTNGAYH